LDMVHVLARGSSRFYYTNFEWCDSKYSEHEGPVTFLTLRDGCPESPPDRAKPGRGLFFLSADVTVWHKCQLSDPRPVHVQEKD
jgi:hypothetical protein